MHQFRAKLITGDTVTSEPAECTEDELEDMGEILRNFTSLNYLKVGDHYLNPKHVVSVSIIEVDPKAPAEVND